MGSSGHWLMIGGIRASGEVRNKGVARGSGVRESWGWDDFILLTTPLFTLRFQ